MAKDRTRTKRQRAPRSWYFRAFVAGLATLLPTILTIALLIFAWGLLNKYLTRPINDGVKWVLRTEPARDFLTYPLWDLERAEPPPGVVDEEIGAVWVRRPETRKEPAGVVRYRTFLDKKYPSALGPKSTALSAIGLVLGVTLIFFTGLFVTSFLGRRARRWLESEFYKIPIIKAIYPYAKQVTEFIFKEDKTKQFTQVVAVEYPRKGIYSIGFVTGEGFRTIASASGRKMVHIFIPSSPTPVTGYVIFVPEEDTIPLSITADEALRFAVSGGVLVPEREAPEGSPVKFHSGEIAGISGRTAREE